MQKKEKKKKQVRHRDALQPKTQPTNEVIKLSIHFKRSKCFLHFEAKHGRWGGEVQIIEDESTKGKSGKEQNKIGRREDVNKRASKRVTFLFCFFLSLDFFAKS